MANVGIGASGIGSLFGAAASLLGASALESAADTNAKYLNQSADYDLFRGELAQLDVDRQARTVLEEQKTSYAAQNVDLSSETVSVVREETMYEARRAKNLVELDAAMSAWGKREQARIGKETAKAQALGMRIGAAGQVIGGVGSLFAAGA